MFGKKKKTKQEVVFSKHSPGRGERRVIVQSFGIKLNDSVTSIPKHCNMREKREKTEHIHSLCHAIVRKHTKASEGSNREEDGLNSGGVKSLHCDDLAKTDTHKSRVQKTLTYVCSHGETDHTKLQSKNVSRVYL